MALAARNRQVLTYDITARLTGVPRQGLGGFLAPIQSYCQRENLEPLTILIVSKENGLPGEGFIAAEDIPSTQMRVFEYDWIRHGAPSPQDLEEAYE